MKLSLVSCSSAELTSVSFHPCKIQTQKLYLQLVKKSNHLPALQIQGSVRGGSTVGQPLGDDAKVEDASEQ